MNLEALFALEGKLWSKEPPEACSPFDRLLWNTASELGSMLELALEIEDMAQVAPGSVQALQGVDAYLEGRGVLRPQSVLLVLLRLRRHQAGLAER